MNDLEKYHDQVIGQELVSFESPPEPGSRTTSDLIKGVLQRWYIVLLTFFIMCAVGLPAIWLLLKPLYTVIGAIRVAPILSNILTGKADQKMSNYQSFVNTQAVMITSRRVVQRVADDLINRNLSFFENEPNDPISKLKQKLKGTKTKPEPANILKQAISDKVIAAAPSLHTELIEVTMNSTNSEEAMQIVDAFISAYMAVEGYNTTQEQDRELTLLENEQSMRTGKIQNWNDTIRQLAQEYGTTTFVSRQDMMLQRITSLLAELTKVEARRVNLETQVQLLEQFPEQTITPEEMVSMRNEYINSNTTVRELTRNIVQLETDLITFKQMILAAKNPQLKQKKQLLDAFQSHLEEKRQEVAEEFDAMVLKEISYASKQKLLTAQTELELAKTYEKRLQEVVAKEDTQTIELGRTQLQIQDLQSKLELDKETYDKISRRIEELRVERKRPARVSVAFLADIAFTQDKRIKYTIALMFGGMACGMLLAFLKDKADLRLQTLNDVTKCIGIRIIGTTTSSHTVKPALLPGQIAEDYQTIRINLGLLDVEGIPNKLIITSPGIQESKTTFAINLATSLSRSGKKVLLIDGDLRKPDIARLLNLPKASKGLQDVLLGREFNQAVYSIPSTGLDVLASDSHGGMDAYELIASPIARQRINELSEKYDHVIIDTPPVLVFPDALIWAKFGGAVILTSFAGKTTTPELRKAKERLTQIDARVLGAVLSNVQAKQSYSYRGYGHYKMSNQGRILSEPGENCWISSKT